MDERIIDYFFFFLLEGKVMVNTPITPDPKIGCVKALVIVLAGSSALNLGLKGLDGVTGPA